MNNQPSALINWQNEILINHWWFYDIYYLKLIVG
ncbi:hypothetical protein VCSRO136_0301 [Vibrio cholerae]|nr:hypothetical protein VCSRO136_0301 [Vibrio cholerae]